jgi:flagellar basal body-associated protein FliL
MSETQKAPSEAPPKPEATPPTVQEPERSDGALRRLLNPPREAFLVRFLLAYCFVAIASLGLGTWILFGNHEAPEEVAQESAPEKAEKPEQPEKEEAGTVALGASPLPKEVLKRRKGEMEEGHDYIEPNLTTSRDVASMLKDDLKVSVGSRFVTISDIVSGLKDGRQNSGLLTMEIALEVTSQDVQRELEDRKTEIRALISSIASDIDKSLLTQPTQMLDLKVDIFREVNHVLVKGQVTDVLFQNFTIKE